MGTGGHVYRFGRFELDSSRRILNRSAEVVWLPDRQMDVLLLLVDARRDRVDLVTHGRNGRIRSKDSYGNEGTSRKSEH